jgi:hypothetical protein
MGMQREEIAELPVNHPADPAVRVFTFDAEHGFLAVQRIQAVRYTYAETME